MKEETIYPVGTIKLTWIDDLNNSILHSKMYKSVDEALKNTQSKKNWLIFNLKSVDGDNYTWDLLPYGTSKKYQLGMSFVDNKILMLSSLTLVGLGVFYVFKLFKK